MSGIGNENGTGNETGTGMESEGSAVQSAAVDAPPLPPHPSRPMTGVGVVTRGTAASLHIHTLATLEGVSIVGNVGKVNVLSSCPIKTKINPIKISFS